MQKEEIDLKIAKEADAERITQLVNSVYRGENSKKGWTTEADFLKGIRITEEKIREIIASKNDMIIMAFIGDDLFGCVHLEKAAEYSFLGMLSVDVNVQTKGIGKLLIHECERYTKEVFGLNDIRMKVIGRRIELIEYYKRRGYELTNQREDFIPGGDTFGETEEKLHFEILKKML